MPSHLATAGGAAVHPGRLGDCPACQASRRQRSSSARPSRQARGYDATYDGHRAIVVAQARAAAEAGQPMPCAICSRPLNPGESLTAEHLIPLRAGGTNELANLAPAHATCNYGWRRRKRAIFLQRGGRGPAQGPNFSPGNSGPQFFDGP